MLLTPGPEPVEPGVAAVIVDVLRATSTLTHAFANGAVRVVPARTPDEALALRRHHPAALLCGERDARILPGFDLGNSPAEYSADRVAGRTLVFASTNGSIAMLHARPAARRILGAFVNTRAVVRALDGAPRVTIVCSGKLGRFSLEDAAYAGWLCRALEERGAVRAGAAADFAVRVAPRDAVGVRGILEGSSHGRYLRALGGEFLRDVSRCAELDVVDRAFEI